MGNLGINPHLTNGVVATQGRVRLAYTITNYHIVQKGCGNMKTESEILAEAKKDVEWLEMAKDKGYHQSNIDTVSHELHCLAWVKETFV